VKTELPPRGRAGRGPNRKGGCRFASPGRRRAGPGFASSHLPPRSGGARRRPLVMPMAVGGRRCQRQEPSRSRRRRRFGPGRKGPATRSRSSAGVRPLSFALEHRAARNRRGGGDTAFPGALGLVAGHPSVKGDLRKEPSDLRGPGHLIAGSMAGSSGAGFDRGGRSRRVRRRRPSRELVQGRAPLVLGPPGGNVARRRLIGRHVTGANGCSTVRQVRPVPAVPGPPRAGP